MASLTANCTCSKCGGSFTKEFYDSGAGAYTRLREKVAWAERGGIDLCLACYKQQKQAKNEARGLVAEVRLSSALSPAVWLVFDGDTYPHKDALKSVGARWTDGYPDGGVLGALLALSAPPKRWVVEFKPEEYDKLPGIIDQLPLNAVQYPSEMELAAWRALVAEAARLDAEKAAKKAAAEADAAVRREQALAELGSIPAWPQYVKDRWPSGGSWNGKFYGTGKTRRVYLGGEEVRLTMEQAEEMEQVAAARRAWREKKEKIEKGE